VLDLDLSLSKDSRNKCMSERSAVKEMMGTEGEQALPAWSRWLDLVGMSATLPLVLFADRLPDAISWLVIAMLATLWLVRLWRRDGRVFCDFLSLPILAIVLIFVPISLFVSPLPDLTMARTTLLLWGLGLFSWIANDTGEVRWKLVIWIRLFIGLGATTALIGLFGMKGDSLVPSAVQWIPESLTFAGGVPENELAGALLVFLAPVLGFLFVPQKFCPAPRWILVLVFVAIVLALVATKSRGGMLGAALSVVALAAVLGNKQVIIATVIAGLAGVCGVLALWSDPDIRVFLMGGTLQGASFDTFFSGRFSIWEEATLVIRDLPLTGTGLGTFGSVMDAAFPPSGGARNLEDAHQQFLQAGTDFGVAGAVCWIWVWGGLFVILMKLRQRLRSGKLPRYLAGGLLAGFCGFLLFNLLDAVSPGWVGQIGFWCMAGLAVRMRRQVMGKVASRGWLSRGLVPVAGGLVLAIAAAFMFAGGIGGHLHGLKLYRQLLQDDFVAPDIDGAGDAQANALWLSGLAKYRSGESDAGEELWSRLVTRSPRHLRLVRSNQPQNAVLAEVALQADSNNAEACFWLSEIVESTDPDRSISLLRTGLSLEPGEGREWLRLGDLLTKNGNQAALEDALHAYGSACRNGDPGANGCVRAGGIAEQLGRASEAFYYYQKSNWEVGRKRARELHPSGSGRPIMTYVWCIFAAGLLVTAGWYLHFTRSRFTQMRITSRHWKLLTFGSIGTVALGLVLILGINGAPSVPVPGILRPSTFPDARMQLLSTPFKAGQQQLQIAVPENFTAADCLRSAVAGQVVEFRPNESGDRVQVAFDNPPTSSGAVTAFFWKPVKELTSHELRQYFISPDGRPENAGTEANPWDLRSALDGRQKVDPGSIIWCKAGTYSDPQRENGLYRSYNVVLNGAPGAPIHIRPLPGQHALIEGGFGLNDPAAYLWIGGFEFENPDAVPGGEPTPPGSVPKPLPDGFGDWGGAGIAVMSGANHVIYNNVTHGGSHAFSAWNASPGTVFSGNIAYDAGWIGSDRAHGHCIYAQNAPDTGTKLVRHNLFCVRSRKVSGNYALYFYAETPVLGRFRVWENAVKGPVVVQSEKSYAEAIDFQNNVVCSVIVGKSSRQDGRGNSFGKHGQPDRDIKLHHNIFINGVKRVTNNEWENVDEVATRVIKTQGDWWASEIGSPPAFEREESGDFVDYSKGGADEFRFWPNEINSARAHIAILDFDQDGSVAVDPGTFLSAGDRYRVFHYREFHPGKFGTAQVDGIYAGQPIVLKKIEKLEALDMFVLIKHQ
jgi:O-antigen ligase